MDGLGLKGIKDIKAVLFDIDDTLFDSTTLAEMAIDRSTYSDRRDYCK